MTKDVNIGFIGGYMLTQSNVPRENRFISVLKNNIENNLKCLPVFHFSSYSDFNQLKLAFSKVSIKGKPDILILQIRPQPFLIMSKLLIRQIDEYNKPSTSLNPLLIGQRNIFKTKGIEPPEFKKHDKKPWFMKYNLMLGRFFRLNESASQNVFNSLFEFYLFCVRNNIHLFLLGISPQPMTRQGNLICKQFNSFIINNIKELGLDYIDSFNEMNSIAYFQKNMLYLSEAGHKRMGKLLYYGMYDYIYKHFTDKTN